MPRPTMVRAGGIAVATTALALATGAGGGRALTLELWRCPLRQLTGIPCPTCYLTRSVLAALQGDLAQAIHWHAFGPLLVALTVGLGFWVGFGGRVSRLPLRQGALVLALLAFAYWLLRLWSWSQGQPLPS